MTGTFAEGFHVAWGWWSGAGAREELGTRETPGQLRWRRAAA